MAKIRTRVIIPFFIFVSMSRQGKANLSLCNIDLHLQTAFSILGIANPELMTFLFSEHNDHPVKTLVLAKTLNPNHPFILAVGDHIFVGHKQLIEKVKSEYGIQVLYTLAEVNWEFSLVRKRWEITFANNTAGYIHGNIKDSRIAAQNTSFEPIMNRFFPGLLAPNFKMLTYGKDYQEPNIHLDSLQNKYPLADFRHDFNNRLQYFSSFVTDNISVTPAIFQYSKKSVLVAFEGIRYFIARGYMEPLTLEEEKAAKIYSKVNTPSEMNALDPELKSIVQKLSRRFLAALLKYRHYRKSFYVLIPSETERDGPNVQ